MGVASMVVGILAFVFSLFAYGLAILLGLISLAFAIVCLIKKQSKGMAITGLVMSLLAILFAGMIMSGEELANETTITNTNTNETIQLEKEEQEKERNKEVLVGQTFTSSNMKVKFISKNENFKDYSKYSKPKSGNKVIRMEVEFENLDDSDEYFSSGEFECYADGYACEYFYSSNKEDDISATLSKGKKAKGAVYFEVPTNAKEIVIEYEYDWLNEEKVIFKVK